MYTHKNHTKTYTRCVQALEQIRELVDYSRMSRNHWVKTQEWKNWRVYFDAKRMSKSY